MEKEYSMAKAITLFLLIVFIFSVTSLGASDAPALYKAALKKFDEAKLLEKEGVELLVKAAALGNSDALYTLAYFYDNGYYFKKDKKKAFYLYDKSAHSGNMNAQFALSLIYYNGGVCKKDRKKSFLWMKKSAENGKVKAMVLLSLMYFTGEGVVGDRKKAKYWMKKAIRRGSKKAKLYWDKYNYDSY